MVFLVRTAKIKSLITSLIKNKTGMEVCIEHTRISWPYDIELENIRTVDFENTLSGFKADSVKIGIRLPCRIKVVIKNALLRLMKEDKGKWAPYFLEELGNIFPFSDASLLQVTDEIRKILDFSIYNTRIEWLGAENNGLAIVDGIDCILKRVKVTSKQIFYYYKVSADEFEIMGQGLSRNFKREWFISSDGSIFEEIPKIIESNMGSK